MKRQRYPQHLVEAAKTKIRKYLSEGLTYNQAATQAAEEFPIKLLSLRYYAYHISCEMGAEIGKTQHKTTTEHGHLLEMANERLHSQGYKVLEEQNEIRKQMLAFGVKGNPDLYATRGQEIILVEVYVDDKKLIDQLNRYSRVGKVVLVLPVKAENIEVWGKGESYGKDSPHKRLAG